MARKLSVGGASGTRKLSVSQATQEPSIGENFVNEAKEIGRNFVEGRKNPIQHDINAVKGMGSLLLGEAGQFARATGMLPRSIPQTPQEDMAESFNKEKLNELRHPIQSFKKKPIGTTLDALSIAAPFQGMARRGVAGALEGSAARNLSKAEELTARVLKPKDLDVAINKGQMPVSVTESTPVIKKVKSYKELRDLMEKEKQAPMRERDAIYESNKAEASPTQLDPSIDLLEEQIKQGRTKPAEIKKTKNTIQREMDAMKGETIEQLTDPNYLQTQKEFYQGKADSLYNKRQAGTLTGNESAELKTYERLAKGYQTKLEQLDERIPGLNRQFQGRNQAQGLASEQAAKEMVTDKPSLFERTFGTFNPARNVVLEISKRGRQLPRLTGKIENLVKSAESRKNIASVLRGEKKMNLPSNPLKNERGSVGLGSNDSLFNWQPNQSQVNKINKRTHTVVELDGKALANAAEKDLGESLAWNPQRAKTMRNLKPDAMVDLPEIELQNGAISIGDGRHRLDLSRERGSSVKILVPTKDAKTFRGLFGRKE